MEDLSEVISVAQELENENLEYIRQMEIRRNNSSIPMQDRANREWLFIKLAEYEIRLQKIEGFLNL